MELRKYFESTEGTGVLATADGAGAVDVAVYGRPHVVDEHTVSFIMAAHLSHKNLQSNPHAAYLFHQKAGGYAGKRLQLTRLHEETDPKKIAAVERESLPPACKADGQERFLVTFRVDSVRPLVEDGAP